MNASQFQRLGSAYKFAKSVLDELQDGDQKHTIFTLSSAVGALETLCLQENAAALALNGDEKAEFVAAGLKP